MTKDQAIRGYDLADQIDQILRVLDKVNHQDSMLAVVIENDWKNLGLMSQLRPQIVEHLESILAGLRKELDEL